ncbi:Hmg1 2-like protein, partial [Musa troglodytarum]
IREDILPRNRGQSWTARLQREAAAPTVGQGGEKHSVEDGRQCEAGRRQRGERLEADEIYKRRRSDRRSEAERSFCNVRVLRRGLEGSQIDRVPLQLRHERRQIEGRGVEQGRHQIPKRRALLGDFCRVAGKRKAAGKVDKKAKRGRKAAKDANKPKRPASAFFVFMEEFRKTFQEKHPENKKVSVVSKACGDKWKSMSESEKAPYVAKAAKRKAEYEKIIASYDKKQSESSGGNASAEEEVEEEGSDKSKSEVEDEEDGNEEEEEDEE